MSPKAELYRAALEEAGRKRSEAERLHQRARATIRSVVPMATDAGLTVSEIAELLGLTPQGVRVLIR